MDDSRPRDGTDRRDFPAGSRVINGERRNPGHRAGGGVADWSHAPTTKTTYGAHPVEHARLSRQCPPCISSGRTRKRAVAVQFDQIAGYTVIRQLGSGGMGQVFLVTHPRLPRRDAMKLLDSGVSRNDEFRARFRREADLLAQLSHPNIVTLFDRGEFEGRLWITMEFVDGTDAAVLSKANGALQIPLAVALIDGAAAALDYAWRKQRITHRDVKPANILIALDCDGGIESIKLADFGIAKAAGESTSLTSTGITVSTVAYLSPEAIEGRDLDNRADLYSLGCTAFQLITGTPPFSGTTIAALMSAHLTRPQHYRPCTHSALPTQCSVREGSREGSRHSTSVVLRVRSGSARRHRRVRDRGSDRSRGGDDAEGPDRGAANTDQLG